MDRGEGYVSQKGNLTRELGHANFLCTAKERWIGGEYQKRLFKTRNRGGIYRRAVGLEWRGLNVVDMAAMMLLRVVTGVNIYCHFVPRTFNLG